MFLIVSCSKTHLYLFLFKKQHIKLKLFKESVVNNFFVLNLQLNLSFFKKCNLYTYLCTFIIYFIFLYLYSLKEFFYLIKERYIYFGLQVKTKRSYNKNKQVCIKIIAESILKICIV